MKAWMMRLESTSETITPIHATENAIRAPIRETTQADGRIRRWVQVPEMENRFLRVVTLADGETVHNAFFDRRFTP